VCDVTSLMQLVSHKPHRYAGSGVSHTRVRPCPEVKPGAGTLNGPVGIGACGGGAS
jgi:hypothetical protein